MRKIRFDRLKKLAEHLRKGKLAHKRFDFEVVHINGKRLSKNDIKAGFCGTAGCAVGELPAVFKKDWSYGYYGQDNQEPCIKYKRRNPEDAINWESIRKFFCITKEDCWHLFDWGIDCQKKEWLPPSRKGRFIGKSATKETVAQNIEWFIKNKGFKNKK